MAVVIVMMRVGTLDHPVARSSHVMPTPKGGGAGIAAAFAVGIAWLIHRQVLPAANVALLIASLMLAGVSYWDDVKPGPVWLKLGTQCMTAAFVMAAGDWLHVIVVANHAMTLPAWIGVPLTLAWFVFVTNAVNFIDGLNGLAAGCVAVAALALAVAMPAMAPVCLPLVAGLAGFLPFNYPRARIFMGDVGSQFCGFVVADLAVRAAGGAASLVMPLALLPILADVAFTLARRAVAGARLTQAHRGHLYQVASRAGMTAPLVSALYWLITAWAATAGVIASHATAALTVSALVAVAILPLPAWLAVVLAKTKKAGLTRW